MHSFTRSKGDVVMRAYSGVLFALLLAFVARPADAAKIIEFDVPGASDTEPRDINNSGDMTGGYSYSSGAGGSFIRARNGQYVYLGNVFSQHINAADQTTGFLFASGTQGFIGAADGSWTAFDAPGANGGGFGMQPLAIDDKGNIIGIFGGPADRLVASGFLRDSNGNFTTFDAPGAGRTENEGTFPRAFGAKGRIFGYFQDTHFVYHGFMRTPEKGDFTNIDLPEAGTGAFQGTLIYCRSSNGTIGGTYFDSSNVQHGFIRLSGGGTITIDFAGGKSPIVLAVNRQNQATGYYLDINTGDVHSFLRDSSGQVIKVDVTYAQSTEAQDMNEHGVIVGYYLDHFLASHGFIRRP